MKLTPSQKESILLIVGKTIVELLAASELTDTILEKGSLNLIQEASGREDIADDRTYPMVQQWFIDLYLDLEDPIPEKGSDLYAI